MERFITLHCRIGAGQPFLIYDIAPLLCAASHLSSLRYMHKITSSPRPYYISHRSISLAFVHFDPQADRRAQLREMEGITVYNGHMDHRRASTPVLYTVYVHLGLE